MTKVKIDKDKPAAPDKPLPEYEPPRVIVYTNRQLLNRLGSAQANNSPLEDSGVMGGGG